MKIDSTHIYRFAPKEVEKVDISVVIFIRLSVPRSVWRRLTPTAQIFVKFRIRYFYSNLSTQFLLKSVKNDRSLLRENLRTFISRLHWALEWRHTVFSVREELEPKKQFTQST